MFRSGRSEDSLQDYSTCAGKMSMIYNKVNWRWIFAGFSVVALMTWAIIADTEEQKSGLPGLPRLVNPNDFTLSSIGSPKFSLFTKFDNLTSSFKAAGDENILIPFPSFKTISLNTAAVKSLHLKNVLIEATQFSNELQAFPNLEKLILDKVTVNGDFLPAYLPKLTDFTLCLHRNEPIDNYKIPARLKSLLFFDLTREDGDAAGNPGVTPTWELNQLLNLRPNLHLKLAISGTTILEIDPSRGLINLNVKNCDEILRSASVLSRNSIRNLTLSWCTVSWVNQTVPPFLEHLNLNNAVPKKEELAGILGHSKNLREFHALLPFLCENISYVTPEYPELQLELNVANFPPTIRTVSVSKMMVTANKGELGGIFESPITNLAIETSNLTGILDDFDRIFGSVQKIAVFNLTFPQDAYRVLDKILDTNADWILMTQFQRKPATEKEEELEGLLTSIGVPDLTNEFLIERTRQTKEGEGKGNKSLNPIQIKRGNLFKGRSLTEFEANYYRFTLLAFDSIDTYDDYMIFDAHARFKYSDRV